MAHIWHVRHTRFEVSGQHLNINHCPAKPLWPQVVHVTEESGTSCCNHSWEVTNRALGQRSLVNLLTNEQTGWQ